MYVCVSYLADGSGITVAALARACAQAPEAVLKEFEYINAAKNMIFPHYVVGVSVLGASSAEASAGGGGGDKVQALAGHAATIMVDTLGLLKALEKGGAASVAGSPVLAEATRVPIAEARFNAMFPAEILAMLPEAEQEELKDWATAKQLSTGLAAYGIEGTTPASPILYATGQAYTDAARNASNDEKAFAKAAPNVGRSIKILYTGGANAQSPHRFYHDFVEFNLGRSHPLWVNPQVRELGAAMTQVVFGKEPSRISGAIEAAGATPRDLVVGTYSAVPLVTTNAETAALLDYASEQAELDVMPPRAPTSVLSPFLSSQLARSMKALSSLDEALKGQKGSNGHPIAYTLAYSTLVGNPMGVEHLCARLRAVAETGVVDSLDIQGLARDANGAEAGKMIVVNALVPVE